jgi:hypothetical protein
MVQFVAMQGMPLLALANERPIAAPPGQLLYMSLPSGALEAALYVSL